MSQLRNKSDILHQTADLLHKEGLYPAVAHSAYYSCLQLSKHLWLHIMRKTESDLEMECKVIRSGTHEVLIRETRKYIKSSNVATKRSDARVFNEKMGQLKALRIDSDYRDMIFKEDSSKEAIALSKELRPILEKYL